MDLVYRSSRFMGITKGGQTGEKELGIWDVEGGFGRGECRVDGVEVGGRR